MLNVLARIRALAPDYPDTQGLEEAARAALDRAKREEELDALYTRAQLALGEGRLPDARALLAQVRALDPAYRESATLAARVEKQLAAPARGERAPGQAPQRPRRCGSPRRPRRCAAGAPAAEQAAPRGAAFPGGAAGARRPGRGPRAIRRAGAPGRPRRARSPAGEDHLAGRPRRRAVLIVAVWLSSRRHPSKPRPQSQDRLALDLTPNATMELVAVPAGEFLMGTNTGAGQPGESNEAPQHTVYLDAYYIGQYEVTVEQFAAFVEDTGYQTQAERKGGAQVWRGGEWLWAEGADWRHPNGPDSQAPAEHPVTQVTWEDAAAFARWAARVTGRPVRLPTEAEWEKAARGDDGRFYPWGSQWEAGYANIDETGLGAPADVGSYRDGVSPYGAEDMAGNVWEWVQDWYGEDYYPYAPAQNPTGPADGDQRVVRGGSWYDNQWSAPARPFAITTMPRWPMPSRLPRGAGPQPWMIE